MENLDATKAEEPQEYENTARPMGTSVVPQEFVFVDVFLTEDFPRLRDGVNQLMRSFGTRFGPNVSGLDRWFATQSIHGGGWHNLKPIRIDDPNIASIDLGLLHVGPSIACLTLAVHPSDGFVGRFETIISQAAQQTVSLVQLRSGLSVNSVPPRSTRKREIEDLSLELNVSVVSMLRRYVGAGLSLHGPLPVLEVFSADPFPTEKTDKSAFWESLEMSPRIPDYGSAGLLLFNPHRWWQDEARYPCKRVLIDRQNFVSEEDCKHTAGRDAAISLRLHDRFRWLPAALGLRHLLSDVEVQVADIRDDFAPRLGRGRSRPFLLRAFGRAQRLDQLSFLAARLDSEVDWAALSARAGKGLTDQWRVRMGLGRSKTLAEDWAANSESRWERINRHLSLLRESYDRRLNVRLQSAAFWLAIVGTALTLVGLLLALPDEKRAVLFKWLGIG